MGTGRDELEELTRTELVRRAKSLGLQRADVLTRPELIDEILSATVNDESERKAARGLLGRARDLVARVVEKGLHLPDAAQRFRTLAPTTPSATVEPIPTVALAQVYASQGHKSQARRILQQVLETDPGNAAALALRNQLEGKGSPSQAAAPQEVPNPTQTAAEPSAPTEDPAGHTAVPVSSARKKNDVPTEDSLNVIHDAGKVRVSWRLRPVTFARTRARVPEGRLVLRCVHTLASDAGPQLQTDDHELDRLAGSVDVAMPEGALSSHVALGWRDGSMFRVLMTEPRGD